MRAWCLSLVVLAGCDAPVLVGGGSSSTSSSTSSSGGASSSGGSGSPDAGGTALRLEDGLRITRVTFFQAVAVDVFRQGAVVPAAARAAPLLQGRTAVVRVHVEAEGGWSPHDVTAEVLTWHVDGSVGIARDTRTPSPPSSDDALDSAFNVLVDGAEIRAGDEWAVRLVSPTGTEVFPAATHAAHVPVVGSYVPLDAEPRYPLKVHLVPVRYDRDGTGRLPDTSAAQLARIRSELATLYPAGEITLTVGAPLPWDRALTLFGNVNFDALNEAIYDVRAADAPDDDVYYYGLISAADTLDAYCGNGCVTGQSWLVEDPLDAELRVGAGMGFSGADSVATLVHELGHMFGREHAPCDVSDADASYPYVDGSIGSWGYDERDETFVDPAYFTDFMGYCDVQWVSDYTFSALYARARAVDELQPRRPAPSSFRMLYVESDGATRWGGWHRGVPGGGTVELHALDGSGAALGVVRAAVARRSHGGWMLRVPVLPADATQLVGLEPTAFTVLVGN